MEFSHFLREDIQNLKDATARALFENDTEDIKRILRQGVSANVIIDGDTSVTFTYGVSVESFANCSIRRHEPTLGNILLHPAVMRSDYELIKLLLENGANVTNADERGKTALHIACLCESSLEIIKLLIGEYPPYIFDLPDVDRKTPLDYACLHNCPDVVRFLLSRGSSVGANDENRFPVWCAVLNEVTEYRRNIVSLLIEAGANINRGPDLERTPLIQALHQINCFDHSYIGISILLIELGCDVNVADRHGQTALHLAVEKGLENVVWKLLISGCDLDKCDFRGSTLLRVACRIGSRRLVDLLISYGANLQALDRKSTLESWQRLGQINEKNTQLLNYAIDESKKCLTLESLCYITIRKNIRNIERDAVQLGLPPLLVKRLQLKDWCKSAVGIHFTGMCEESYGI